MRTIAIATIALLSFAAGHLWRSPVPAPPQQEAVTLQCQVVGPCSQYLVQVNSGRGFGRFQVFQLSEPIDQTQLTNIGAGYSVAMQAFEPYPRGSQTFTLSLSEP